MLSLCTHKRDGSALLRYGFFLVRSKMEPKPIKMCLKMKALVIIFVYLLVVLVINWRSILVWL